MAQQFLGDVGGPAIPRLPPAPHVRPECVDQRQKLMVLFREKAGLAYYVSSALEKTKGLMFIRAGIDHNKFDDALKIIKEQLYAIQSGDISDDEINNTRSGIISRLKSIEDNASSFIDYDLELSINNRQDTLKELKEQFLAIKKEDITSAAQKIKVDTIYLLSPKTIKSPVVQAS